MAKTTRRGRRTVREELEAPIDPMDSIEGQDTPNEFHDTTAAAAKVKAPPRLSLPLTDDERSVNWDRVRDPDKARSILGLNDRSATSNTSSDLFGADMLGLALDMLSTSLVSTFKAAGYTVDSAEATRLTDADKAALIPRYEKVLAKHAPALGKYEDEIMAGVTTLIVFGGKLMLLKKAATVTTFPRKVETPEMSTTTMPLPESES